MVLKLLFTFLNWFNDDEDAAAVTGVDELLIIFLFCIFLHKFVLSFAKTIAFAAASFLVKFLKPLLDAQFLFEQFD